MDVDACKAAKWKHARFIQYENSINDTTYAENTHTEKIDPVFHAGLLGQGPFDRRSIIDPLRGPTCEYSTLDISNNVGCVRE